MLSQALSPGREYLIAAGALLGLTGLNAVLVPWIGYWSVALIFLMGIMGLCFALSRRPVLLAAGLSALLWNFFFIPPIYTLHIQSVQDLLMCLMYILSASLMAGLTHRVRTQEHNAQLREQRLAVLYRYSRQLAEAEGEASLIAVAEAEIELALKIRARFSAGQASAPERSVPLKTPAGDYGHLVIDTDLSHEQSQLLETLAQQLALALEREWLQQQSTRAQLNEMSTALHDALMNSVSHELRTPLTTIQGAVQNLQSDNVLGQPEQRRAMLDDLISASRRLDHLVANLLDMSRLQSGRIGLHRDWCDLGDILRAAVKTLARELKAYPLTLELPADLPPIQADFGLLEQAIINVIHNALAHNPPGTAIRVSVRTESQKLLVSICDQGKGIPPESLPQLFDKFYRAPDARSGGTGLGLSIARGFIEAHQGRISAANQAQGGACFLIELPVPDLPELPQEDDNDPEDSGD